MHLQELYDFELGVDLYLNDPTGLTVKSSLPLIFALESDRGA